MSRRLNDRELATVLAALRGWQEMGATSPRFDLVAIATNGGKHYALTIEEIDDLCERLNLGEVA